MEISNKLLPISAPIPAGQTRPVKIPKGSKVKIAFEDVQPGISGSVIFNEKFNHHNIDYEQLPLVFEGLVFPCDEGCFFNHSTGDPEPTVIVTTFFDDNMMVVRSATLALSPPMPAGQTRPVKIPWGKKIKIIEEPLGTVGQVLLRHVDPPEIIAYPQVNPTVNGYNFVNEICCMKNEGPAGTSVEILAVD